MTLEGAVEDKEIRLIRGLNSKFKEGDIIVFDPVFFDEEIRKALGDEECAYKEWDADSFRRWSEKIGIEGEYVVYDVSEREYPVDAEATEGEMVRIVYVGKINEEGKIIRINPNEKFKTNNPFAIGAKKVGEVDISQYERKQI